MSGRVLIKPAAPHKCDLPRSYALTKGDLWECDECHQRWLTGYPQGIDYFVGEPPIVWNKISLRASEKYLAKQKQYRELRHSELERIREEERRRADEEDRRQMKQMTDRLVQRVKDRSPKNPPTKAQ